jgi:hypothetical protein
MFDAEETLNDPTKGRIVVSEVPGTPYVRTYKNKETTVYFLSGFPLPRE